MQNLKSISLLLIASILLFSCGENEKKDSKESNKLDMASILTEKMVRETFNVGDTVTLEPDLGSSMAKNYIQYKWEMDSSEKVLYYYSVTLNFSNGTPLPQSNLDAIWDSQNENVYKNKDMENVSGVGRKASWSTLGGGQLRVVANKYLFYLSLSGGKIQVIPGETGTEKVWPKKFRMKKGADLAKEIVNKLK